MIYRATLDDITIVANMAAKVWESNAENLFEEFKDFLTAKESAVFVCQQNGNIIGFAQCQLRHDYVEGTQTSPVGYLEGIFVEPDFRKQGYGKALVAACEGWAKEQGCTEFASDCPLENALSIQFHLRSGFLEANRIVCFTKHL